MTLIQYSQNFLHNDSLVKELVQKSSISSGDTVLEIGAGKGIITKHLASKVGHVGKIVAVESDAQLVSGLQRNLKHFPQVEVVDTDIREWDWKSLIPYKVFSNIPFFLTSEILSSLLDIVTGAEEGYIIAQKEAIQMFGGRSVGGTYESLKSLLNFPYYETEIKYNFLREDFVPKPSVDIALLHFRKREVPLISLEAKAKYFDFVSFIASDRVGEGTWKMLFRKEELKSLERQSGIVYGRGIKQQSSGAVLSLFRIFEQLPLSQQKKVSGSFEKLKSQQAQLKKSNRTRLDSQWKHKMQSSD